MDETQEQINSIQKMIKKGQNRGETEPLMPEPVKKAAPARKLKIITDAIEKQSLAQPDTMLVAENDAGMQDGPRKNEIFADVLGRLSTLMNKKGDNIRSRIYSRAQDTVLSITEDITDVKQLEGKPNIGPTILAKMAEYSETGTLRVFEREKDNPEMWLTDIYGIGPKKAQELVKQGIKTIEELREQQDKLLNDIQRVGLKYYDDILKRIPRNEIEKFDKEFESSFNVATERIGADDSSKYEIVGSYRRGAKTSGDIDVIITSKNANVFTEFVDDLKRKNVIIEVLSRGKTKCLVIAKLPGAEHARRVDFMYTSPEEFPFAILYFTGSKAFNTVMRGYALRLGLSLNEHGIYTKEKGEEKGEKIDKIFVDEESIFSSLYLKFKLPEQRIDGRAVETTLPIIPDTGVEKKGQSCYKSCDTVPGGECATGCSPSWTDNKLIRTRNWCTCNVDKKDCIIPICPAHSEPEKPVSVQKPKSKSPNAATKPVKSVKTRKVALDADGNPKVRKPRKTKKASPSAAVVVVASANKPKSPVIADKPKSAATKPAKTRKVALDADGNPKVRKQRKTKKESPSDAADNPTKPKAQKPRKTKKTVTLNVIATKLELDETGINDEMLKTTISNEAEVLPELVPILHMNKVEPIVEPAQKPKNTTIKRKRVKPTEAVGVPVVGHAVKKDNKENDIKLNDKEDNMEARINNAKQLVTRFRVEGIDMLDTLNESQLVEWLEAAGDAYYNTKTAIMSDNEYDIIKEYMEVKYPTNEVLTNIGANVTKNKVELPYKMASMDKIKPDTNALATWRQKYKGPYVLSCKLDGVSGLYTTEGGVPKLYTRGNGTIGQDVSHLLSVLKLPLEPNSVVRGELIMPRVVFEEKYKSKFANPRNLVSGIVNSKTIDDKTSDLHFVAYEVIRPSLRPSEQLQTLIDLGHEVVQHKSVDELTNEKLSELLMDWRTNYEYEIDGVIVTDDNIYLRKDGNPDHAFAFKMVISDQVAEAKVVDVIWTPSKSGYLKPRVRIEPVRLGGVTIEYATGFNGKFIESNKIGVGAVIQIIRSGDVIPYIKSVTVQAEMAKMPNVSYHWTETNVDIVLDNMDDDETVQAKNITDFFTGLEVDGLGGGNVKKIMNAGYKTVPSILKMTKDDYAKVEGFKTKMVNKIYDGIQTQVENASLVTIMASSNKFGRGIGMRKIQPIMTAYPKILTSPETTDRKIEMLQTIDGIGKENAKSFATNIPVFLEFIKECDLMHKIADSTVAPIQSADNAQSVDKVPAPTAAAVIHDETHPLYGKHVVMTKVRDAEIIDYLKKMGGVLDDNISKKTFALIVKSLDDVSNKTKKAVAENIPIMTPEMFKKEYMNA
jgi:NAD-dependent DNA ligase